MLRYFLFIPLALSASAFASDDYQFGPDSQRHTGVPKGSLIEHTWANSKIFPGTTRKYWVYVPVQYKADQPAPYMIFQDGDYVMNDDSAERAAIVLDNLIHQRDIPVMIAIFINPGVIPAASPDQQPEFNRSFEYDSVSDRYARFLIGEILPDVSKEYNLSKDPSAHGIAGHSSSGICAFTAAWNRPDVFRRLISFVGSFADLRGGDIYPSLIRKTEPKPLRIFLQDGKNDQNIYAGNWYLANQAMASALEYAGYDVKFVVGEGGHSIRHGATILPDALRWLWRDYPQPITARKSQGARFYIGEIVGSDQPWRPANKEEAPTAGLSSSAILSADHSRLLVSDPKSRWISSFPVRPDGVFLRPEPYYRLEMLDESSETGAYGMAMDTEGFLYVATKLGIQICDANGRVVGIMNAPSSGRLSRLVFGGPDLHTLYATSDEGVFRREIRRKGVPPGARVKLPRPIP